MILRNNATNPFIDGPPVPPEKFIGREREVDIILDRLANPYSRGGSMVSGPSGIGKTSLLHYLHSEDTRKICPGISPDVVHCIYIPVQFISPFSEMRFWEFLFGELEDWLGSSSGMEKIIESLRSGTPPSRFNISRFFTRLGRNNDRFVVALLDGFDLLMGEINKDDSEDKLGFLHTLQSLLNLPAPRGFSLITSSEHDLYDLFENAPWFGSDFYNTMANLPLGPFNERQMDDLINRYLAGTGVVFDQNERNHLKQVSSGHPKKLQQEAFRLFEEKVKGEIMVATSGPQQFAMMVLTQAISFLFDEASKILAERRQRRQEMEEADDTVALPAGVEESSKETILELKPTNLDEETQQEINHLLELIKIQRDHRRKAELKINKLGGILFVPPNVRVELENAEDEILKHTHKLKKLLEKVYGQPIYIDGLE
jgi:AAA+ ATPase superfamily predicted ATPase